MSDTMVLFAGQGRKLIGEGKGACGCGHAFMCTPRDSPSGTSPADVSFAATRGCIGLEGRSQSCRTSINQQSSVR